MVDKQVGGVLRWEEPPARARRSGRALFNPDLVLKELKAHPGDSAVIVEGVSQSYAHSSPLVRRIKELGVEVTATKINGNGKHVVYGRVSGKRGPGRPRKEEAA